MRRNVIALVPDLMDRSRMEPVAEAQGLSMTFVGEAADLLVARDDHPDLVIIDLDVPGVLAALPELSLSLRTGGFEHLCLPRVMDDG